MLLVMEPWQFKQIDTLKQILNSSMVYADIGACRGELLGFLSSYCYNGYAFEPEPNNFKFLQQYFNNPNIILINKVVSDISGPLKFFTHQTHMGNILGHNMDYIPFNDYTYIESIKLDDFFENINVDFIKLDVEGAEWKVFDGSKKILENRNIVWQVEFHLDEDWHRRTILYDYGYNIYDLSLNKLSKDHPRIYQGIVSKNEY